MSLNCAGDLTRNADGTLSCSGDWEIVAGDVERLANVLELIFSTPEIADIQTAINAGFTLPALCYLVAYFYGLVINWFNVKPDDD